MKRTIIFICVIAVAITINSCKKRTYYWYAHCATGHAPWDGTHHEYPANGTESDTRKMEAGNDASDHDKSVHGGVLTAEVLHGQN